MSAKPQPNPETQRRLDAHDGRARALEKAEGTELGLGAFHAQCVAAGITSFKSELSSEGWRISISNGQTTAQVLAPKDQPWVLYAVIALESFKAGGGAVVPNLPPDVPLLDEYADAAASEPGNQRPPDVTVGEALLAAGIDEEKGIVRGAKTDADLRQERAAELERRAKQHPNSITKPTPAGAGQRKPLSLPLCVQCKAQPVYSVGAQHCGAECAKQWHMNKAARSTGAKL